MSNIGKLTEIDVRELWAHEQYDFSNWLAKDENIEYLNDILGLTLTDVDKEAYVGPYRCDIVATDETSGIKVIIENQLESTNHDHLGKIITYASGLNAKVIVWIVSEAKEEHRAAIEWLNNNTVNDINFFLKVVLLIHYNILFFHMIIFLVYLYLLKNIKNMLLFLNVDLGFFLVLFL